MLKYVQLLHLADSALPIGSLSHSFGLESMTSEEHISPSGLFSYLGHLLEESLLLEAVYCRSAHTRGRESGTVQDLNQHLSAVRLSRESRSASLALGRRFMKLVMDLEHSDTIQAVVSGETHLAVGFGFACGVFGFTAEETVMAFLHQAILNLLSAAQRLMPVGQSDATRIAWDLKPEIVEAAKRSLTCDIESVFSFSHLPELASMRHPSLATRLFIS